MLRECFDRLSMSGICDWVIYLNPLMLSLSKHPYQGCPTA